MMKQIIYLLVALIIFIPLLSKSQGCSDAGFCTIGNLKPQSENDSTFIHRATVSLSYGVGEQKVTIMQIILEIELSFFKNNSVQIKIPYTSVNGNLGSNSGIGDLALSVTQTLKKKENIKWNFTLGIKLPTGSTNEYYPGPSFFAGAFPMPYQTGLGTTDLIIGTSLKYKKWNFALGFQGILKNKNENKFLHSLWLNNTDAQKYFESNLLERGNDALVRIEKSFQLKKINLSLGVLNIIHLNPSSIVDSTDARVDVKGSDGLTVNVTGNMIYEISKRTLLNFSFGVPTIVRDARPDGLTRKLVLALSLRYNFGK